VQHSLDHLKILTLAPTDLPATVQKILTAAQLLTFSRGQNAKPIRHAVNSGERLTYHIYIYTCYVNLQGQGRATA
jgi:hypothetical protein